MEIRRRRIYYIKVPDNLIECKISNVSKNENGEEQLEKKREGEGRGSAKQQLQKTKMCCVRVPSHQV